MREKIGDDAQERYWDSISDEYHDITRIDCSDFHYGPQIPGESALHILPEFSTGMTALEIGCGGAQNSVWLAKRGVRCTAFDISRKQLAHAKAIASHQGVMIDLRIGSFADFRLKTLASQFDFVHSSHAIEFVENPRDAAAEMAASVKKGGWLMISTVHPVYNGDWMAVADEDDDVERDGQFLVDYFNPPDDIRDEGSEHVVSRAYPVSAWFKWLREAGLEVTALEEPAAIADAPYSSDDWAAHGGQLDVIPSTVIFVAKK